MAVAVLAREAGEGGWARAAKQLAALVRRLRRPRLRQLRLRESLALGERRFVAVVEFEQQRFLIGGTSSSVALLSQLPDTNTRMNERGQMNVSREGELDAAKQDRK
jgi:flagellar biogenesis protein FliO